MLLSRTPSSLWNRGYLSNVSVSDATDLLPPPDLQWRGMTTWGRRRWLAALAVVLVGFTTVALTVSNLRILNATSDLIALMLMLVATVLMARNAYNSRGQTRLFWGLITVGCVMWATNQAWWAVYELILLRPLPDPFPGDIILFFHVTPFMAALAFRPHRQEEEQKLLFSTLNFLMLLIWWAFLYAFLVFPDEYVMTNVAVYSHNYDILYLIENFLLLLGLGLASASANRGWRRIYRHLFMATAIYTFSSEAMNAAIARGQYYSGSLYDLPFLLSIAWMIYPVLLARDEPPASEPVTSESSRWLSLAQRLAMTVILSLPVMGLWAIFYDTSPLRLRHFRVMVTLASMLVLGVCIFIRQYLLDRQVMSLLDQSHRSLENLQRLQSQLVQQEKLASLGQLVAGAAHEINNPLAAILGYSELLEANPGLKSEQVSMAQKIGQQARRTRELVSGLLSFAQQSPAEKAFTDLVPIIQRAMNMERLNLESSKIQVEMRIASNLPKVWGNANQLLQCCLQIVGNAIDALGETGGGSLVISATREADEVVLEFADNGPGIREPRRVFDPFYTTKPVGKGTGLGLSITYGVIQDHKGQINCYNRPEGGAVFVLRLPISQKPMAAEAKAAQA
jgi:signal transduction histidine kinase